MRFLGTQRLYLCVVIAVLALVSVWFIRLGLLAGCLFFDYLC